MTQQLIVTTPANTGLGSSPKAAFDICNANFTDLYNLSIGVVSVLTYGADPTGAADSTAAFRAAGATGKLINVPAGTYLVNSSSGAILITGGGMIGAGSYQSTITDTSTGTNNTFTYTGALAGVFENLQLYSVTKTGGFGIAVVGTGVGEVSGMRFFQLVFNGMPNDIFFQRASLWTVIACNFYIYSGTAIQVDNQNVADSGDSTIMGCVFNAGNITGYGIQQVASGGLKIVGNKFNNNAVGYLLALGLGSTSDLLISGNSFENSYYSGIQLQRASGAAVFGNVQITGNEFLVNSGSGNSSGVYTNNGSAFLGRVAVCANTFKVNDTGTASAIIINYVTDVLVDGNTMQGSGGSSTGVILGANNASAKYGVNVAVGFTTTLNAPAGTFVVPSDYQTGTTNITCSTANGSLFYGTATITFPTAFTFIPILKDASCVITSAGGGGGIAAEPYAINATQIFLTAASVTNGGIVPVRWSVGGVI